MSWLSDFLFGKKVEAPPIGEQYRDILAAYLDNADKLNLTSASAQKSQAATDFDLAKAYDGQYLQHQTDLNNQYGAGLVQSDANLSRIAAENAAKLEQDLITKYGQETARQILATQEAADPRGTEEKARLFELLKQYQAQLSPELSGSETAAINRSLAQQNPEQAGSSIAAVRDATLFGQAGAQKVNDFGAGIAQAASLLPAVSSGVNPFNVSTLGRGTPETATSIVDKTTGAGRGVAGQAQSGNALNNIFGLQQQKIGLLPYNKDRGFLQAWTRGTEGLGNLASAAGGFAAACYIARLVFGVSNPEWVIFYNWLHTQAPERLRSWYIANGSRVAAWLTGNEQRQLKVRKMMEKVIYG